MNHVGNTRHNKYVIMIISFLIDNHQDHNPAITHPTSIIVPVVGFLSPYNGDCCEECNPLRVVEEKDVVLRERKEQSLTLRGEQAAICMYWVANGIEYIRVMFLKRAFIMHDKYNGA